MQLKRALLRADLSRQLNDEQLCRGARLSRGPNVARDDVGLSLVFRRGRVDISDPGLEIERLWESSSDSFPGAQKWARAQAIDPGGSGGASPAR